MDDKIRIAKAIAKAVGGSSAAATVTTLIAQNVTPMSKLQMMRNVIGASVLGGVAGLHARNYIDQKFDETVEAIRELKTAMQATDK